MGKIPLDYQRGNDTSGCSCLLVIFGIVVVASGVQNGVDLGNILAILGLIAAVFLFINR